MYAVELQATIEKWVRTRDNKATVILQYNKIDLLKLMTLRTWELRYRLSAYEILDLIVPILRGTITTRRGRRKGTGASLGITISMLTGQGAERILESQIKKTFPNAEHIAMWKSDERNRQLQREKLAESEGVVTRPPSVLTVLGSESVSEYVEAYRARIETKRTAHRSESLKKSRRSKNYRGNPWR